MQNYLEINNKDIRTTALTLAVLFSSFEQINWYF